MSRFDQCECGHLRGDHEGSAPQPCGMERCVCNGFELLHARPYAMDPMTDPRAAAAVFDLVVTTSQALGDFSAEQREMFFSQLRSRFCIHCGSPDPGCQCWNDE